MKFNIRIERGLTLAMAKSRFVSFKLPISTGGLIQVCHLLHKHKDSFLLARPYSPMV